MELFERYIKTDGITFKYAKGKSAMRGKEFHVYNEIIFFIGGEAELITEHSHSIIKPHTVIVLPKETYHQLKILGESENYHRCIINFSAPNINSFFTLKADGEIKYLFSKITDNINSNNKEEILKAVLVLLVSKINSEAANSSCSPSQNPYIIKCIEYINQNLCGELSVEALAKAANLSQSSIAHIFKKEMGIPLHRYVTEKRLIAAYRRIFDGDAATAVCLDCGFKDYSNFYRQYKKFFGFPPSHK